MCVISVYWQRLQAATLSAAVVFVASALDDKKPAVELSSVLPQDGCLQHCVLPPTSAQGRLPSVAAMSPRSAPASHYFDVAL